MKNNNRPKKKVTGAALGTIIEYYDYSLYGFSAAILASKFFPNKDHISALMYVFAIYALSYLAKPFGSIFFSHIGDLYGRRISLRLTITGIALPTFMIGLLPDYNSIGVLSYQILIICRFFQGFFAAGEYDGAAIYTIEHVGKKYHYTASAITRSAGVLGLLLGILSTNFFNSSIFPDWGWRIPFLLSAPLAIIIIYYRNFLEETPDFINSKKSDIKFDNIRLFIKNRWKLLFLMIFLAGGFGVTYQVSIIFMKQYLPIIVPYTSQIITVFSFLIVLSFGIAMPISGLLADRFGSEPVIKYSLLFTIFSSATLAISVKYDLMNLSLVSCILLAISVAPFNALAHGVAVKIFKINERYRGIGLGHATGSMLMSGTANYVCLFFMSEFNLQLFPLFYICFFAIVAYSTILILSKKHIDD